MDSDFAKSNEISTNRNYSIVICPYLFPPECFPLQLTFPCLSHFFGQMGVVYYLGLTVTFLYYNKYTKKFGWCSSTCSLTKALEPHPANFSVGLYVVGNFSVLRNRIHKKTWSLSTPIFAGVVEGDWINKELHLYVEYLYNETCGERKSNHGEGCMQKSTTIRNSRGEVLKSSYNSVS